MPTGLPSTSSLTRVGLDFERNMTRTQNVTSTVKRAEKRKDDRILDLIPSWYLDFGRGSPVYSKEEEALLLDNVDDFRIDFGIELRSDTMTYLCSRLCTAGLSNSMTEAWYL